MKLEVGMYVRTVGGLIGKIFEKYKGVQNAIIYKIDASENDDFNYTNVFKFEVSKASHSIIDLIGIGDIITTNNLCGEITKIDIENNKIWIACCDYETCRSEDIKSIVTKEQFESMSYKVGE